jgi:hypothetical protein
MPPKRRPAGGKKTKVSSSSSGSSRVDTPALPARKKSVPKGKKATSTPKPGKKGRGPRRSSVAQPPESEVFTPSPVRQARVERTPPPRVVPGGSPSSPSDSSTSSPIRSPRRRNVARDSSTSPVRSRSPIKKNVVGASMKKPGPASKKRPSSNVEKGKQQKKRQSVRVI